MLLWCFLFLDARYAIEGVRGWWGRGGEGSGKQFVDCSGRWKVKLSAGHKWVVERAVSHVTPIQGAWCARLVWSGVGPS